MWYRCAEERERAARDDEARWPSEQEDDWEPMTSCSCVVGQRAAVSAVREDRDLLTRVNNEQHRLRFLFHVERVLQKNSTLQVSIARQLHFMLRGREEHHIINAFSSSKHYCIGTLNFRKSTLFCQ